MKLWRVVVLLNLALAIGFCLGYLAWGRPLAAVERELALSRLRATPVGVERVFTGQGVVRALISEIQVVVLTHDEIAGFMPAMTMGFRTQDPQLFKGLEVGDSVRFTLKGVPPNLTITELVKQGKS
jgi:Cu/Ag efflux protein CusF